MLKARLISGEATVGCEVEGKIIQLVIIEKDGPGPLFTPGTEGDFNTPTGTLQ